MFKNLIYLAIVVFFFSGCEEIYTPDIENVDALLVVEAHITNDMDQNFVKLSLTRDFYSQTAQEISSGGKVELIEVSGKSIVAKESGTGYFTFTSVPVSGKNYLLRVTYNQETYQSDAVTMPPLPQIDTLYTKHNVEKEYRTYSDGTPVQVEIPGREFLIDAPITSSLSHYLFNYRAVLQYAYYPPVGPTGEFLPPWFGWKSFSNSGSFNLAGPKEFSVSDKISTHPVFSLAYDPMQYLDSITQVPAGWIIILDQYGIQKESYDFHEQLNKQFSAEGNLFDPMLTQVYGNIHCTSDPDKICLGFFDLNSYRQYRYFFSNLTNNDEKNIPRRLFTYPDIPNGGYQEEFYPSFWESYY